MNGKQHLIGGISAAILFSLVAHDTNFLVFIGSVTGSLIPDIDSEKSLIKSKVKVLNLYNAIYNHAKKTKAKKFFQHRGIIFHSFLTVLFFLALACAFRSNTLFGISIGVFSHHLLDATTPQGLRYYFYPLNRKR